MDNVGTRRNGTRTTTKDVSRRILNHARPRQRRFAVWGAMCGNQVFRPARRKRGAGAKTSLRRPNGAVSCKGVIYIIPIKSLPDKNVKASRLTEELRKLDKPARIPDVPITYENLMGTPESQIGGVALQVASLRAQHKKAQASLAEAQAVERALRSELRDVTLELTKLVEEFGL